MVEINLENKIIKLHYQELDTDIDADDLTQIHSENLYGEIVTVSTLMNKIGILKADMENILNDYKLAVDVKKATLEDYYRKKLMRDTKKPTISEVENALLLDKSYQNKKKKQFRLMKELAYIDSLYWSIQSKDRKLSVLMKGITPQEFEREIVEGEINGIFIKKHEKLIK